MKAYADTGFVVTLYKEESTTARAAVLMNQLEAPAYLSPLSELEFHNALHLAVFRKEITGDAAALKKELFLDDLEHGIFTITPVPPSELYPKSLELAAKHSPVLGTRSLDLMHVAAALIVKADTFLSFDERQREAAGSEGLKVRP